MEHTIYATPADCLQAVFDQAPENAVIRLAPGIYRQKAVIRTRGLQLRGAGRDNTILVYGDYAKKPDENGVEYVTFRTYTLAVCSDHVRIQELSVVNDALEPEHKGQEVALSVVADDFVMTDCRLRSTQDTLFAGPLPPDLIDRYDGFLMEPLRRGGLMRQRFIDCLIEGTVDFIFGCGDALFENCRLNSLYDVRGTGYVAAPAHGAEQTAGFVFRSCRFTRETAVPDGSVYLARPWRDYGLCRFENCSYEAHIAAVGFDKWNDSHRDLTARFYEVPALPGRAPWSNRK